MERKQIANERKANSIDGNNFNLKQAEKPIKYRRKPLLYLPNSTLKSNLALKRQLFKITYKYKI